MSTTTLAPPAAGFTREACAALLEVPGEPAWLRDLRHEAWDHFERAELPTRREEEWMRTDVRLFRWSQFQPPLGELPAAQLPTALLTAGVDLGGQVTWLNSRAVSARLDADLARQGVLFGSLDAMVREHGDRLRPYFESRLVTPTVDKFAALHHACWTGGALLYVPRNVAVAKPLHLLSALASGGVDLGRVLVVLEEGAEATLLLETAGDETPGLHCGSIELFVGPRARLRFVSLQNWGHQVWHFAHQKAVTEQDGSLQWTIGALGSRLAKVNQHVALRGPGAETQVNGVMFTEGKQHLSYHTLQHHEAPGCRSDLLYKGGLQDESRIVWRGMIKVDRDAQKTDGYQRDDNLILSEHARADSIPGLEIEADDVRCTHGATTGHVDEEQIFYACSRGLTRKEAIRMIVTGFFQQVFDRITIDSVKEALTEAISRRVRAFE